jgi:hypothetical protein
MDKKAKAIKVTDQAKPWEKRKNSYQYDTIRTAHKTILIVCEGQTEEYYFSKFPVISLSVKCVNLQGQSKMSLVKATQDILKEEGFTFDEVWCVFDMDVNTNRDFTLFDKSIAKAKSLGYNVAYSNDCFELWLLLHYKDIQSTQNREYYYEQLGKCFKMNYVKNGKKIDFCKKLYTLLQEDDNSSEAQAIIRAEKLYLRQKHLPYHQQKPVTLVYQLVRLLNEYKRA